LLFLIAPFELYFGFPSYVATRVAIIPIVYCIYSLTCHFTKKSSSPILLKIISIANLLYCVLTITLIVYFFPKLTIFGIFYFIIEMMILVSMALWEWKIASSQAI
jgi:hypothetical protein